MAEPTMRDVLDRLATVQATVQQQGAKLARYERRGRRRRTVPRLLPLLLVTVLAALLPLSLLAANPTFSDLNDAAAVHRPNIQAIGNAGITTGFEDPNDPNARLYNPKGLVTREEMASFLARTAGLAGNAPVVNALTAQNATTVGGYAPGDLVRVALAQDPANDATGVNPTLIATYYPSYTTAQTIRIVAPAAGFVLIQGEIGCNVAPADDRCAVRLRDTSPDAAATAVSRTQIANNGGSFQIATIGVNWVFPVAAAGTRTYTIEITDFTTGVDSGYASAVLTALFVPFGYNGGTTLAP